MYHLILTITLWRRQGRYDRRHRDKDSPSWSWNGLTQGRNPPLDFLTQLLHHFLDAASQKIGSDFSLSLGEESAAHLRRSEESFRTLSPKSNSFLTWVRKGVGKSGF